MPENPIIVSLIGNVVEVVSVGSTLFCAVTRRRSHLRLEKFNKHAMDLICSKFRQNLRWSNIFIKMYPLEFF